LSDVQSEKTSSDTAFADGDDSRAVSVSLSTFSRFYQAYESLDDNQKSALKNLLTQSLQDLNDGTFDAADLAAQASDDLLDTLAASGATLDSVLTEIQTAYVHNRSTYEAPTYTSIPIADDEDFEYLWSLIRIQS